MEENINVKCFIVLIKSIQVDLEQLAWYFLNVINITQIWFTFNDELLKSQKLETLSFHLSWYSLGLLEEALSFS